MKKLIVILMLLVSFQQLHAMNEEMKSEAMDKVIKMPNKEVFTRKICLFWNGSL